MDRGRKRPKRKAERLGGERAKIVQFDPPTLPKTVNIKPQGRPDYEANMVSRDPVKILVILHDMAHNHDSTKDETMAIVESDMKLMMGFQGKTASVDEFLRLF